MASARAAASLILGWVMRTALALSADDRFLFVVNPGSDDLSVFAVQERGLRWVDRIASGGRQPLSVAVFNNLVYVLNGGGNVGASDNISGFIFDAQGRLTAISNSTQPLSADVTAGANRLQPQRPGADRDREIHQQPRHLPAAIMPAVRTAHIVTPSDAITPFGFYTANGNQLFVSDDFNDVPGLGAMSSFLIGEDGHLTLVSSAIQLLPTSLAGWWRATMGGLFIW